MYCGTMFVLDYCVGIVVQWLYCSTMCCTVLLCWHSGTIVVLWYNSFTVLLCEYVLWYYISTAALG